MVLMKPATPVLDTLDPLSVGLVAAYPFFEGAGSIISDLSGNAYAGSALGGFSWAVDSEIGTYLSLDGTSAYVALAAAIDAVMAVQTTASVAFWIKLRNATPTDPTKTGLMDMRGFTGISAATKYPAGGSFGGETNGSGYFSIFRNVTRVGPVNLGATNRATWHHLCITQVSNSTYIIYVNGVQVASFVAEFNVGVGAVASVLGRSTDTSGGPYYLDGFLGDFRIWRRVLNAAEVLTLFNDPWALYGVGSLTAQVKAFGAAVDVGLPRAVAQTFGVEVDAAPMAQGAAARFAGLMVDVTPSAAPLPSEPSAFNPQRKPDHPPTLYENTSILTGLQFAMPFTEGSGNPSDYSGNARNGVLTAPAVWTTRPEFLTRARVNSPAVDPGATGRVNVARDAIFEPAAEFSISAWVYSNGNQGSRGVFSKLSNLGGSTQSIFLGTTAGGTQWAFGVADDIDGYGEAAGGALTAGLYFLTAVYRSQGGNSYLQELYVNGSLVATRGNASNNLRPDATKDVWIGRGEGFANSFSGFLHEMKFWNKALSTTEIAQLYNAPFGSYCNAGFFRALGVEVEAALYPQAALQTFGVEADVSPLPDVGARFVGLMVDVSPAAQTSSGMGYFSISPVVGPKEGGTTVTIKGFNFENITQVTLGGVPLTSLTVVNRETITGITGAHVAGFVDIQIVSSTKGPLSATGVFAYVGGFGPGSQYLISGSQLDAAIIRQPTFTGENTPNWPAQDTTLALTLPDFPVAPDCVEVYVRHVGEEGGRLVRQGNIYSYVVDMANRKLIWKTTAPFALVPTDEVTVYFVAQGQV